MNHRDHGRRQFIKSGIALTGLAAGAGIGNASAQTADSAAPAKRGLNRPNSVQSSSG
jgi:nitrous oxide reductase